MSAFVIIGLILIGFVFAMTTSCVIILFPDFKYYREVYNTLPKRKFYTSVVKGKVNILSHRAGQPNDHFYYLSDGSLILKDGIYINNSFVTYFSPYTLYYLIKYRLWFKNNIDVKLLESYI